jgi:hypothetical protein
MHSHNADRLCQRPNEVRLQELDQSLIDICLSLTPVPQRPGCDQTDAYAHDQASDHPQDRPTCLVGRVAALRGRGPGRATVVGAKWCRDQKRDAEAGRRTHSRKCDDDDWANHLDLHSMLRHVFVSVSPPTGVRRDSKHNCDRICRRLCVVDQRDATSSDLGNEDDSLVGQAAIVRHHRWEYADTYNEKQTDRGEPQIGVPVGARRDRDGPYGHQACGESTGGRDVWRLVRWPTEPWQS